MIANRRPMGKVSAAAPGSTGTSADAGADKVVAQLNWRATAAVLGSLTLIGLTYVWIISAGKMTAWPSYSGYYDMLADAFLHGQTSLLVKPDPNLLALPDPYDPQANAKYRMHDALLYNGKYYLYWGPAPAVLVAAFKRLTGIPHLGDEYLVFAFIFGTVVFSALLMNAFRRHLFPDSPWWLPALGTLVAGLGTPMPFILARAAVYEAAICAGQFFLIGGLYWAFAALQTHRLSIGRLFLAGACLALAPASRVSLALAVPAVALLLLGRIFQTMRRDKRLNAVPLAAFCAPLLAGAVALGSYNHVRFGSWSEFGTRYQLAGVNIKAFADSSPLMSVAYVAPNLYNYLLRPMAMGPTFPFVTARWSDDPLAYPSFVHRPPTYSTEAVAGVLRAVPFVWLAIFAPLGTMWQLVETRRRGWPRGDPDRLKASSLAWITLCLLSAGILAVIPALLIPGATMRYLADGTPVLVLLATLGGQHGHAVLRSVQLAQRAWLSALLSLVTASVLVGLLLGMTGYSNHFEKFNPDLFRGLTQTLSFGRLE
jgi:hypothetical protein